MTTPNVKVSADLEETLRTTGRSFESIYDTNTGKTPVSGIDPSTTSALNTSHDKTREHLNRGTEAARKGREFVSTSEEESNKTKAAIDGTKPATTLSSGSSTPQTSTSGVSQAIQQAATQAATQAQQQAQQMQQALQQMQAQQQQASQAAVQALQSTGAGGGGGSTGGGTGGLSRDEVRKLVQEAIGSRGGTDAPNSSGSGKTTSRGEGGKLETTGAEKIDPSQVTYDKTGIKMSEQEAASVVMDAADLLGIPDDDEVRQKWVNLLVPMASAESGLNADAANGWDSNAHGETQSDGYPANSSRGPWQTIPTTFAAYHVGGTSTSIYDPTASAAAAMNYIMDRYDVGADASNIESFASDRGIDVSSGIQGGSYKGY